MNFVKTLFLLTLLTMLLIFIGGAIGGQNGMRFAFMFACLMNLGAYWFSDKLVLMSYRARPLTEVEAPEIHCIVEELAAVAKMPKPKIYLIPSQTPNAFATGRNPKHAVIGVTQGILELLSEEELRGVLAHELSHVRHQDILIASIAATMAGAISMLSNMARWALMFGGSRRDERDQGGSNPLVFLVMAIVAPIAALLIQLAVSRSREFEADKGGAELLGDSLALARALRKLETGVHRIPMVEATPTTAHLFIVNPLRGNAFAKLFSTHPPMEERIERLEQMARR